MSGFPARPLVLLALPAAAALAAVRPAPRGPTRPPPAPAPRVTVDAGTLEGAVDSASGVLVFRGVPYAAPPVGDLRWRAPRPVARWRGVRQATRPGRNCMQPRMYDDIDPFAAGVSEDCLTLTVWTTALGTAGAGAAPRARPVMVWIHGGGFRAGFGGEERHHGARLAQKGAVVVTLNYRLGPFGFLAHPALAGESAGSAGSGNYGLLDQMAALRWVQRNAGRFGGDPARVTVFGESAGAMSVAALVASPLARGLFQRAILESMAGLGTVAAPRDSAEAAGARFAARLGVTGTGPDAAARLRALGADSVLAGLAAAERPDSGRTGAGARPAPLRLQPVVDGRVLPRPVDSALARGPANVVPVIVGSNADEGDAAFGAPARAFARLVTARGAPAYLYHFTRVGDDSANRRRGAYHSAEITFVFGRPRPILESAGRTAYDSTLAEAMSDYWVAFAARGTPNGPPAAGRRPAWPAYARATDASLELGAEVAPRQGVRRAAYDSLDAAARARGEVRP
jgi:para-nitrobenzyl esterase